MVADIVHWSEGIEQFQRYLIFWWRKDGQIWCMTVVPKDMRTR